MYIYIHIHTYIHIYIQCWIYNDQLAAHILCTEVNPTIIPKWARTGVEPQQNHIHRLGLSQSLVNIQKAIENGHL